MVLLCVICSWHAVVSIIDNHDLLMSYSAIDGVVTLVVELNSSNENNTSSNSLESKLNKTILKRSYLTFGQQCDRYALIFFAMIYILLHFLFILWMYLVVSSFLLYF